MLRNGAFPVVEGERLPRELIANPEPSGRAALCGKRCAGTKRLALVRELSLNVEVSTVARVEQKISTGR
jgi:hypothetical protein